MLARATLQNIVTDSWAPALVNVFQIQANLVIETKIIEAASPQGVDLVASMPIVSQKYRGLVGLLFPESTFLKIANHMLGDEQTEISDANIDAAGEMLNIVFASSRVKVNAAGHDFQPAIPTTVRGRDSKLFHGSAECVLQIMCTSQLGIFYWESSLRSISA